MAAYIIDADNYLSKTRGAFDSFESGANAEGWLDTTGDSIPTTELGATEGNKAMLLGSGRRLTRPIHYIKEGKVGFDLYLSEVGDGMAIELQTAFNDMRDSVAAPIRLSVDSEGNISSCGKSLGIKLEKGSNKLLISFNGNEKSASLTLNGKTIPIAFIGPDSYISYVTLFIEQDAELSMDRFFAIREDN